MLSQQIFLVDFEDVMPVLIFAGTQEQISVKSLIALGHTKRRLFLFLPQIQPLGQKWGHFGLWSAKKLLLYLVVFEDVMQVLMFAGTQEQISVNYLPT